MGDLSGLLLYKQMKKGKKEKTFFAKIASVTKTLLRQGVFGTEKGFFKKFCRLFCQRLQEKAVFGIMFSGEL